MAKKSSVTDSPRKSATPARATRSQSREVEQTSPRKSARNTRQASVESNSSASARRSRVKNNVAPIRDLTPVNEDEHAEESGDNGAASPLPGEDDDDGLPSNMSVGRASAYSGTTAKTTFSAEAMAQLDPDIMVEMLASLDSASSAVLKVLMPADARSRPFAWKDIATPNTKSSKIFRIHVSNFVSQKDHFVTDGEDYIHPSIVLRALLKVATFDEVPQGIWRPDPILYKANLSRLMHALLVEAHDSIDHDNDTINVLDTAELWFPKAVAGDEWSDEAFAMALAISTQLVIKNLASSAQDPNFDAVGVATNVFFEIQEESGNYNYRHFDALHMGQLSERQLQARLGEIERLVDELKQPFNESQDATVVNTLRAKFPWSTFVGTVETYYNHRKRELDQQIARAGGAPSIVEALEQTIQDRNENLRAQAIRTSLGAGATPKKFDFADIVALKAMEQVDTPSSQPGAPVAQMVAPAYPDLPRQEPQSDGFAVPEDDDNVHLRPGVAFDQRLSSQSPESKKGGKAKMKSIMDRQPGAHRIPWESSQPSQDPVASARSPRPTASSNIDPALRASSSPEKRRFDRVDQRHDDWQPTQDEGFSVDLRSTAAADARRSNMPRIPQRSAIIHSARAYLQDQDAAGASSSRPRDEPSPSKRVRKNPGSAIPPPIPNAEFDAPDVGPTQIYREAKVTSKHNRLNAPPSKQPRERRPWTEEEEDAFMDLIVNNDDGEHISYAKLKTEDQRLEENQKLYGRTAEDLRMKARNMKVTLLLAKVPLPPNWNGVVLGKKEQEKLRSRGVEYEQERLRGNAFDYE